MEGHTLQRGDGAFCQHHQAFALNSLLWALWHPWMLPLSSKGWQVFFLGNSDTDWLPPPSLPYCLSPTHQVYEQNMVHQTWLFLPTKASLWTLGNITPVQEQPICTSETRRKSRTFSELQRQSRRSPYPIWRLVEGAWVMTELDWGDGMACWITTLVSWPGMRELPSWWAPGPVMAPPTALCIEMFCTGKTQEEGQEKLMFQPRFQRLKLAILT